MKHIHESFTEEEHLALSKHKVYLKKNFRLRTLNWHDFILHTSGVKELETNYGRYDSEKKY